MPNVPIRIELLARTHLDNRAVEDWLCDMGVTNDGICDVENMLSKGSDAAGIIALAAKQCYMAFEPGLNPNVSRVRTELANYLDNILKSGHGSVLEHATFTFGINGVSRVFTGEMNRHRAGWSVSERSGRYIRFGDGGIDWWLPTFLEPGSNDDQLEKRKARTKELMEEAFKSQSRTYNELVELWDLDDPDMPFSQKKRLTSLFRRIIGMGHATGGVWTGNVRALRHVITLRADSTAAEEEIYHVFSRIAALMVQAEPLLFGDFNRDESGNWTPKYKKV